MSDDNDIRKKLEETTNLLHRVLAKTLSLRQQVQTDRLTGVGSTDALEGDLLAHVADSVRREKRDTEKGNHLSVAFIDLNDFGLINKNLSDAAGDAAIRLAGQYFDRTLRKEDKVYRKGGDEFVLLMHCPEKDARARMEAIKNDFITSVTAGFNAAVAEEFSNKGVEKLQALQKAIADKHNNIALKEKPYELSFSFGVREIDPKEMVLNDESKASDFVDGLLRGSDEAMRADKAAYVKAMQGYKGTHTERARRRPSSTGKGRGGSVA